MKTKFLLDESLQKQGVKLTHDQSQRVERR